MRHPNAARRQFRRQGAHRQVRLLGQPREKPVPGFACQNSPAGGHRSCPEPAPGPRAAADRSARSTPPKPRTVSPPREPFPLPPARPQPASEGPSKVVIPCSTPSSGRLSEAQNNTIRNPHPDSIRSGHALGREKCVHPEARRGRNSLRAEPHHHRLQPHIGHQGLFLIVRPARFTKRRIA